MSINKFTTDIMNRIISEISKDENVTKIEQKLVDPLIHYAFKRIYPYAVFTGIIFILTFLLAVLILILLIKNNGKKII